MHHPDMPHHRASASDDPWRVLLVDDDEEDYLIVRMLLSQTKGNPVQLEWASSAAAARPLLAANGYQAVLVDYDLGLEKGVDLIREQTAAGYSAPFILYTGRGSYEIDLQAQEAGATLYLTKNEANALLMERTIRYAIERKQAEWAMRDQEQRLRIALDAAELGCWTYLFSNDTCSYDERAQAIYGVPAGFLSHQEWVVARMHPDDIQAMRDALDQCTAPGGDGHYEATYRLRQPDSSWRWIRAWGQVEYQGEGERRAVRRMVGASRDVTREHAAQEARAASEERLRMAQAAARMGTFDYDYVSGHSVWDERTYDLWGLAQTEPASFALAIQQVHPADVQSVVQALNASGDPEGDGHYTAEYRVIRKDGTTRWIAANGQTYFQNEKPVRMLGTVQDITERKQAESALERERMLLQTLFNRIPVMITMYRPDLHMMQFNPACMELLGWTAEEARAPGVDFMSEVYPDPDYRKMVEEFMAHPDSGWRDLVVTARDGSQIESSWTNIRMDDNTLIGIGVDLRARKQAEQDLLDSEERFRDLANNIDQLAWMMDPSGWVFWYNERWYDYTGLTFKEMEGWGWQKVHHPEHVERVVASKQRCLETGQVWEETFPLRGKDGEYRWFLTRAAPIYDAQGTIVRWVGTNTDITELRRLQTFEAEHTLQGPAGSF